MAHSNRKKLKEARGGKTRNQARKAQRSAHSGGQSNRLAETIRFIADNEEKRRVKVVSKTTVETKAVAYAKHKRTMERRRGVVKRLEKQLSLNAKQSKGTFLTLDMVPLLPGDKTRIEKEIKTLKARI